MIVGLSLVRLYMMLIEWLKPLVPSRKLSAVSDEPHQSTTSLWWLLPVISLVIIVVWALRGLVYYAYLRFTSKTVFQLYTHERDLKVAVEPRKVVSFPRAVSKVKFFPASDSMGRNWLELSTDGKINEMSAPIYSVDPQRTVYSPVATPYNIWIALQERTFKDPGSSVRLGDNTLSDVVSNILACLRNIELPDFSMKSWVFEHRLPKQQKTDIPVYLDYQKWLNGDPLAERDGFALYTLHNEKPKQVNTRMKKHEKFLEPDYKPRLYDVFDPIHALIAGPVYLTLASVFVEHVPGYCDGVSLPELKDKINSMIDELDIRTGITDLGFLSCDGSKFDSTQYIELMENIRTPIISLLFDQIITHYTDLPLHPDQLFKLLTNYVTQHNLMGDFGNGNVKLAQWLTHGTTNSGETNTTCMNTIHSIVYMLTICYSANVNVLGYPAWRDQSRPWIAVLAKGDDQVYIGNIYHLELLKEHMGVVYTIGSPLKYRDGKEVVLQHHETHLGQLAKIVEDHWAFISTYAEVENNRILALTRDLERAAKFARTVTKHVSPHELKLYSLEEIIGTRFLIEGNLIAGVSAEPHFEELGTYLKTVGNSLIRYGSDNRSDPNTHLTRMLERFYDTDDFYKKLLRGVGCQPAFSEEYLLSRFPDLEEVFDVIEMERRSYQEELSIDSVCANGA